MFISQFSNGYHINSQIIVLLKGNTCLFLNHPKKKEFILEFTILILALVFKNKIKINKTRYCVSLFFIKNIKYRI